MPPVIKGSVVGALTCTSAASNAGRVTADWPNAATDIAIRRTNVFMGSLLRSTLAIPFRETNDGAMNDRKCTANGVFFAPDIRGSERISGSVSGRDRDRFDRM